MAIFGSWSVVSFLRFSAQFLWAVLLVTLIIQVAMIALFLFSGGEVGIFLPVYITIEGLHETIRESVGNHQSVLSVSGGIRAMFTPLQAPYLQGALLGLFQAGLHALALYGATLLKRVLNEMHRLQHVSIASGLEMRKVGFLLVAAAPLKFLFELGNAYFFNLQASSEAISGIVPPFDFSLLFAGLIALVIAEILHQAARMYHELKLTV
ncbi:MAG: hypothetical protein ACNA78_04945 [Balneolaceae bacterium]